ncbi:MAG: hypothetical protein L7H18_00810 [Candidatus Nealsonbacteria bacterium DGGOD1a]|nr:MAG: hypothetical protein L7H18_00810 [Candidatus Nealsonbacteria bacterium DGGOD1a]
MRNNDQNKFQSAVGAFFKKIALKPFLAFFFLAVVGAAFSALIFLNVQRLATDIETTAMADKSFGAVKAKKFRDVFLALDRRNESIGQTPASTYPDVFLRPAGLTDSEN